MSEPSSEDRLTALRERIRRFAAERDWEQFHDPKNLAMALASEAGELLAELRWVANDRSDDFVQTSSSRDRIEKEVGDIAIALIAFCDRAGIDMLAAAERKLDVNAANYPADLSRGQSERPAARSIGDFSRVIAIDWSGVAGGGRETIWTAEVTNGAISTLENGRSRNRIIDWLIEVAAGDPNIVVGLDFAFAFPRWFPESRGLTSVADLWSIVASDGETWLRDCQSPFWGRPGTTKPTLPNHFRETDVGVGRQSGGQAKSVFQIGGAGAVGTGSIRGMPHLLRLRNAGFSIWPFDPPGRPLVVEIYPRLLTGAVVKSNLDARAAYLADKFPSMPAALQQRAASTEDAFDAAVSALVMWRHSGELGSLTATDHASDGLEGRIWAPNSST